MFGREKKDDLKFKTIPRRTARLDHTFIHRRIEFAATRTSDDLQFTETLRRGVSFVPFSAGLSPTLRCFFMAERQILADRLTHNVA